MTWLELEEKRMIKDTNLKLVELNNCLKGSILNSDQSPKVNLETSEQVNWVEAHRKKMDIENCLEIVQTVNIQQQKVKERLEKAIYNSKHIENNAHPQSFKKRKPFEEDSLLNEISGLENQKFFDEVLSFKKLQMIHNQSFHFARQK